MREKLSPVRIADDIFELKVASSAAAQNLAKSLRAASIAEDVVAGLESVAVRFDPHHVEQVTAWLDGLGIVETSTIPLAEVIDIGVEYGSADGPDFERVCPALGLSRDAFIDKHTEAIHTVEMIGFTPGFSYISGLTGAFKIPRLDKPRPRVKAGSVGISASYTGIYALDGPGGWPLIGHTKADLFNAQRKDPFLLQPGQRLKFKAL